MIMMTMPLAIVEKAMIMHILILLRIYSVANNNNRNVTMPFLVTMMHLTLRQIKDKIKYSLFRHVSSIVDNLRRNEVDRVVLFKGLP